MADVNPTRSGQPVPTSTNADLSRTLLDRTRHLRPSAESPGNFELGQPNRDTEGRYLPQCGDNNRLLYNTGTDRNSRYVTGHEVNLNTRTVTLVGLQPASSRPAQSLFTREQVRQQLGLEKKDLHSGLYERDGFNGDYELRDNGTVFFRGGTHVNGGRNDICLPPQTYINGRWYRGDVRDVSGPCEPRPEPARPARPQAEPCPPERRQPVRPGGFAPGAQPAESRPARPPAEANPCPPDQQARPQAEPCPPERRQPVRPGGFAPGAQPAESRPARPPAEASPCPPDQQARPPVEVRPGAVGSRDLASELRRADRSVDRSISRIDRFQNRPENFNRDLQPIIEDLEDVSRQISELIRNPRQATPDRLRELAEDVRDSAQDLRDESGGRLNREVRHLNRIADLLDRLAAGERPAVPARPAGERPSAARPAGERPSAARPAGERPSAARPAGERPSAARPAGERPSVPARPAGRPSVPARPAGERPSAPTRPAGERPAAPPRPQETIRVRVGELNVGELPLLQYIQRDNAKLEAPLVIPENMPQAGVSNLKQAQEEFEAMRSNFPPDGSSDILKSLPKEAQMKAYQFLADYAINIANASGFAQAVQYREIANQYIRLANSLKPAPIAVPERPAAAAAQPFQSKVGQLGLTPYYKMIEGNKSIKAPTEQDISSNLGSARSDIENLERDSNGVLDRWDNPTKARAHRFLAEYERNLAAVLSQQEPPDFAEIGRLSDSAMNHEAQANSLSP